MRKKLDEIIFSLFLRLTPTWITPNHLSLFRAFLLLPIVALLWMNYYIAAIIVFVFASLLDLFDGVLARKRNLVTETGEWLDACMDKVLIVGILLAYGWRFLPWSIIFMIAIIEVLLVFSRPLKKKLGKRLGAGPWGKIKMTYQSLAVFLLISGIVVIRPWLAPIFLLAVLFGSLSLIGHLSDIFKNKSFRNNF